MIFFSLCVCVWKMVAWQEEREYIVKETQSLFHKNKDLTDPEKIDAKLFEAESRLELGLHYKIPFPRLFHVCCDCLFRLLLSHFEILPLVLQLVQRD